MFLRRKFIIHLRRTSLLNAKTKFRWKTCHSHFFSAHLSLAQITRHSIVASNSNSVRKNAINKWSLWAKFRMFGFIFAAIYAFNCPK